MLDDKELSQLCRQLGPSEQAQLVIQNIRSSPPARRVRSAGGNVSVRYPSRKMGVVIQAESHRNELAGIFEMEHDANTLEYYDQPSPIKLEYCQLSPVNVPPLFGNDVPRVFGRNAPPVGER